MTKKMVAAAIALLLATAYSFHLEAFDGGFELSGHINTGFGGQYNAQAATSALLGAFVQEGMKRPDFTQTNSRITNNFTSMAYLGDVELDISKSFGESAGLRIDLDFLRLNSNSYLNRFAVNQLIEQAYTAVNMGGGYEFIAGRFNTPVGFEAVDVNDNDLPFHSMLYNFLRPHSNTGIKFYLPFSEHVDMHIWFVNNIRDTGQLTSGLYPAGGMRLGFLWGPNTIGLSGMGGPEVAQAGNKWDDWSWFGDIDFNFWLTDFFAVGGEGIFRKDSAAKGQQDNYYYSGLLNLHYIFSDSWDGALQYCYVNDRDGSNSIQSFPAQWNAISGGTLAYTGAATLNTQAAAAEYHRYLNNSATGWDAQYHQASIGLNYHITDGAKIMAIGRADIAIADGAGAAKSSARGTKFGLAYTGAINLAYNF